jgi:hypothetical protein
VANAGQCGTVPVIVGQPVVDDGLRHRLTSAAAHLVRLAFNDYGVMRACRNWQGAVITRLFGATHLADEKQVNHE